MSAPGNFARFPTWLAAVTLMLTLATFAWVTWNAYASDRDAERFRHRDARSQELRGVILHLDEVLTMSARMAAATGDPAWETRYRRYEPELDAAIKEAIALTPGSSGVAPSAQTDIANLKLVAMENEAFALVRRKRTEEARAVLFAPGYAEQKRLYALGMTELQADVRSRIDSSLRESRRRGEMATAGSGVLFVLSIAVWVAIMISLRRTQSGLERRIGERTAALTEANHTLLAEIAERSRIQEELVEARDTALGATRLKAEFLANMSHEIRTPINGVIGMTELALDTELTPEQREYLDMVKSSADSLLTIINDILDFSKIEAGKLVVYVEPFDLHDNMLSTIKLLAARARAKGLELACDVRPDVPTALIGDPSRLRQIVTNLIENAIKFTERGEVRLTVRAESQSGGEAVIRFSVSDTGIGIPFAQQQAIFQPFIQADGSTTRKYGGTGLGLAISTNLVTLLGGRIWLESDAGRGSTFYFTMPFAFAQPPVSRATSPG